MEFRHLRYFLAVAEELHFTRAAEKLNIGQPPLSQQIQALEEELGVLLFNRTRRKVALTEAGEHFVIKAREMLRLSSDLPAELRAIAQGKSGELRIGFTTTGLLVDELSAPLKAFRRHYPEVRVTLSEMYSQQQFTALLNEDIDVGYIRVTPGTTRDGLNIRVLRRDQLCVVLPDDHPKAACETLTITDVKDEPFIFYPDTAGASVPDKVRRMNAIKLALLCRCDRCDGAHATSCIICSWLRYLPQQLTSSLAFTTAFSSLHHRQNQLTAPAISCLTLSALSKCSG